MTLDLAYSKIDKIFKNPEEQQRVIEYLKPIYKHMYILITTLLANVFLLSRECYKYFAAISPANGCFSIS